MAFSNRIKDQDEERERTRQNDRTTKSNVNGR